MAMNLLSTLRSGDPDLASIVVDPASPTYKARIQAPAPDDTTDIAPPLTGAMAPLRAQPSVLSPVAGRRVLLSWGRAAGYVTVAVEEAPDWDLAGPPMTFSQAEAQAVVMVVRALGVKVKDLTGEFGDPPGGEWTELVVRSNPYGGPVSSIRRPAETPPGAVRVDPPAGGEATGEPPADPAEPGAAARRDGSERVAAARGGGRGSGKARAPKRVDAGTAGRRKRNPTKPGVGRSSKRGVTDGAHADVVAASDR